MTFKYYLYVSDAKVDMMLSQIDPSFRRKRTVEWSLNFKLFGARRGTESEIGDNRFARLETVVQYLERFGDLGTVDQPGQFFRGLLPMRWGPLEDPSSFYFGGETQQTVVGLIGSAVHMIGAESSRSADRPVAWLGYALPPLTDALRADRDHGEIEPRSTETSSSQGAINAVHHANTMLRGPEQNLEFLAKRLARGSSTLPDEPDHPRSGRHVLLGTPLYVALVD